MTGLSTLECYWRTEEGHLSLAQEKQRNVFKNETTELSMPGRGKGQTEGTAGRDTECGTGKHCELEGLLFQKSYKPPKLSE
jgi:hypothetical protein